MAGQDVKVGRRGSRATPTAELADLLWSEWRLPLGQVLRDLGGSANLNLLMDDGAAPVVVRVYRPFVTTERLAGVHAARRALASHGLPVVEPIATSMGRALVAPAGPVGRG